MIAFGCSVFDPESYRRYAEPGIRVAAEPDSEIQALAFAGGIPRTYNLMLDKLAGRDDLEALALVHPHAEVAEPDFCRKVRHALRDPDVGVVGCVGASGVRGLAWWEGEVASARVLHRYTEHGGGEEQAYSWTDPKPAPAEVDCVDGFLLVLSPWAVRNIRFDETLVGSHGFDVDFCFQVREAGRKVVVAELATVHHRSLELVKEPELWAEAHIQLAEKWERKMPGAESDVPEWKLRARRAEAEREAARAFAQANLLGSDARILALQRSLKEITSTTSWRVTEPLRRLNLRRAERRERRAS